MAHICSVSYSDCAPICNLVRYLQDIEHLALSFGTERNEDVRLPMIHLKSPVAKAVYGSFLAFCAFYALNDGRTVVALVFGAVSALVFWNASQQWKNATK